MTTTLTNAERIELEAFATRATAESIAAGFEGFTHVYDSESAIEARCDVRVYFATARNMAAVVLTELRDNPGRSVTNAVERIATEVYASHLAGRVPPDRVAWIEHYECGLPHGRATFDRVTLAHADLDGRVRFYDAEWARLKAGAA